MQTSHFNITIGGVKHVVAAINMLSAVKKVQAGRTHRIQIIDRSYSMAYSLGAVVDQSKQSIGIMDKGDLVSTFWFSSPGEHGSVVVGASPGTDAQTMIEGMRRPIGSTCFSEVMSDVAEVVQRFSAVVDQTVIDLFTDGMPCVPWGTQEEQRRVFSAVDRILSAGNVSAFNTIGYGSYYDRDFLNRIAETSEFGAFIHTTDIQSFYKTIEHNMMVSKNLVVAKTTVVGPDGSEILYLSPGHSMRLTDKQMHLSRLDSDLNYLYVIVPEKAAKTYVLNDQTVAFGKPDGTVMGHMKEDFLYAYAAEAFRKGDRLKAVDILANNLRDKALAQLAFNAFTVEEIGETQKAIAEAVDNRNLRFTQGKTGPGFMPAKDALCVMDVLDAMIKSPDEVFYLPLEAGVPKYERVGRKAVDQELRFAPNNYDLQASISDLVWHKEKLNLSIRFTRKGTLTLNPRAADAVGLPHHREIYTWQAHSFVKDGNVNIKQAAFLLPEDLYLDLEKRGVKLMTKTSNGYSTEMVEGKRYVRSALDFSKLPIINRMYIDKAASIDDVFNATIAIKRLEAAQKVVKYVLDDVKDTSVVMKKVGAFEGLNGEQIRVLTEHGMRDDGSYGGVQKVVASVADSDSYEARFIEFDVKGAATLPTIDDMMDMMDGKSKTTGKAKATNLPGSYMIDAWNVLTASIQDKGLSLYKPGVEVRDALTAQLKIIKTQIAAERNKLNVLKMAKALTGDGFKGLEPNDKGQLEYTVPGKETLVIKIARKPVPIDMAA